MRTAALFAALLAALATPAFAADLSILSPGATEGALGELLPRFEQASGHKVSIGFGPAGAIAKRIRAGNAADVLISSAPEAEQLAKDGRLVAASRAVIARVGIGVFVRKGAAKPAIGTVEDFRRALALAKTIAYADPALGGSASILVHDILRGLDADGSIAKRTRLVPPAKPLVDLVAAGGADFAFQPIAQIFLDPRIDYVGPLPAPLQRYTDYVASLVSGSGKDVAYRGLIAFLTSAPVDAVWRARGFEPR